VIQKARLVQEKEMMRDDEGALHRDQLQGHHEEQVQEKEMMRDGEGALHRDQLQGHHEEQAQTRETRKDDEGAQHKGHLFAVACLLGIAAGLVVSG